MNKIEVIFNNQPKDLVIPLESSWDFYGQQEGIEKFEQSVLEQIINKDQDFEVSLFTSGDELLVPETTDGQGDSTDGFANKGQRRGDDSSDGEHFSTGEDGDDEDKIIIKIGRAHV